MGEISRIEWTDATWNPVTGCTKVSQGCKNCYAERDWARLVHLPAYHGRAFTDVECHPERLDQPSRWKRPRRVFVNSMSDIFHPAVPFEFIEQVHDVIRECAQHIFQILTKRPDRMLAFWKWRKAVYLANAYTSTPPRNAWYGVSVEDQLTADERIPLLLQTPAAVRWISAEPLLGPVSLVVPFDGAKVDSAVGAKPGIHALDWVVAGGESGPKARPSHPDWFRSLRDQCRAAGVPFLFKQWGEWQIASMENGHHDCDMARNRAHWIHVDGAITKPSCLRADIPTAIISKAYAMIKVGKARAGRHLDGVLHDEYPG